MRETGVRLVMSDHMSCLIAIKDWHLNVHKDDVWLGVNSGLRLEQVIKSFFSIPYRID